MALSVPLSRFTPRVGGGSAFFVRQHYAHKNMNTPIIVGLVVLVAVILGAKRRPNLPAHVWSKIWSMVFCIVAVGGFVSSLIGYRAASAHRAALSPSDPDVIVSIPSLMMRISLAELLIGLACLVGSVILYLRSQRQRYDAQAA